MTQRPTGPSGQPANKQPNRPGGQRGRVGGPGDKNAPPRSRLLAIGVPIAGVLAVIFIAYSAIGYLTTYRPQVVKVPTQPASGKVFVNKKAVEGVNLVFWPLNDDKKLPRPHAVSGPGGVFRLGTFGEDDGAPPGEYAVTAQWFESLPPVKDEPDLPKQRDRFFGHYADPNPRRKGGEPRIKITIKPGVEEIDPIYLVTP